MLLATAIPTTDEKTPGDLLREWRGERSVTDAAVECGIDAARYSTYEKMFRRPGLAMAFQLEKRTGVPASLWAKHPARSRTRPK